MNKDRKVRRFWISEFLKHGWKNVAWISQAVRNETELETVDLVASGYEWVCPECGHMNHEIETTETVECLECENAYKTNPPEHVYA